MISDIIFIGLSFFAIAGALTMIFHTIPIYSALGLLISVLSIAGLFALLSATFMFMVQIIVYAGAIMTIILFILMFLNIKEENLPKEPKKNLYIIVGFILILPINYLIIKSISLLPDSNMNIVQENFGGIKEFGIKLYQEWLIPFELISILLLVALIGAVVLAKQRTINKIKND